VHYETAEAADAAIKAVNGMLLNDKKVFVGIHVLRKVRQYAVWLSYFSQSVGAPIEA